MTSKWSKLPWKKVEVEVEKEGSSDNAKTTNHYDEPQHFDPDDLYDSIITTSNRKGLKRDTLNDPDAIVDGVNDPGIFLGLEVIDGSQYNVETASAAGTTVKGSKSTTVKRLVSSSTKDDDSNDDRDSFDANNKPLISDKKSDQVQATQVPATTSGKPDSKPENTPDSEKKLTRIQKKKLKLQRFNERKKQRKLAKKRKRDEQEGKVAPTSSEHETSSSTAQNVETDDDGKQRPQQPVQKSKKSKKSKDSRSENNQMSEKSRQEEKDATSSQDIEFTQTSWSITTGVYLHSNICAALHRLNFLSPTPIQSSTLAASILGQRDVVGAAPTGSGKTLSYLLPILQFLYSDEENTIKDDNEVDTSEGSDTTKSNPLTALILCPTRELAMQVSGEFSKLVNASTASTTTTVHPNTPSNNAKSSASTRIECGTIIGGMAEQKQKRILKFKKPSVIIATPGRLWDMMSSNEYEHLSNLCHLRFLVIDEADRMIAQGNFPQLSKIFEEIVNANPSRDHDSDEEDPEMVLEEDDDDRLLGLPGVRGEARVKMLSDDILRMIEGQKESPQVAPIEIDSGEYERDQEILDNHDEEDLDADTEPIVKRQTFVYSATLTLPPSAHRKINSSIQSSEKQRLGRKEKTVDGAIAEILEIAGAQGQTKVVDLSTSDSKSSTTDRSKQQMEKKRDTSDKPSSVKLPPGLSLHEIRCTQKHKDSHLYAFLATTKQGSSGPSLVFCNSIAGVKRVGETLKTLGLPVRTLHAQMQQKARLNALESLKSTNSRSIVVASDVAARGLDISSVANVVHYDVAREIDTFVHRAGRTARGVGEKAVGSSISLVSSSEEKNHEKICQAINRTKHFQEVIIDGRLMSAAQKRANLAAKIVQFDDAELKARKQNQWFTDAANEADLDLDETLLSGGIMVDGNRKERQQGVEANQAKQELKKLLATPMRTQSYGKFLSGAGLINAIKIEKEVKPFVVPGPK